MKDFHADSNGDIFFDSSNDIAVVEANEELAQAVSTLCRIHTGEWYLDLSTGVDYLKFLSEKEDSYAALVREVKSAIEAYISVDEYEEFEILYAPESRRATVRFKIVTNGITIERA